jgi:trafficking protein particle complex subunit 2
MSTSQALLFVIVGRNEPLFETEIHKRGTVATSASDAMARQNYFVLHSALDLVDKAAWTSSNMYLKVVDKVHISITFYTKVPRTKIHNVLTSRYPFSSKRNLQQVNQQQVSCFLTAGNIKFLLLHGGRSEDSIRNFFQDVYELYVKVRDHLYHFGTLGKKLNIYGLHVLSVNIIYVRY